MVFRNPINRLESRYQGNTSSLCREARRSLSQSKALRVTGMERGRSTLPTPQNAVDFLHIIERLKTIPRTGWVKRGIAKPESIADHMYRMGVMSLLVQGDMYDYGKCLKLAIVHDIAESIAGDITPTCGVTDEQKYAMEESALNELRLVLGDCLASIEIEALWKEYEAGETDEAKLVKDFDKIEMILQAEEYETSQGILLQEFFDSTSGKWRTDIGKSWAEEICGRREARLHQSKNI